MGAAAIPIITAVVGAGAQAYNTNRTAKKQDQALAMQIQNQAARQREIDARLNQGLQEQERSNPENDIRSGFQQYMDQLQRTQALAASGLSQLGDVSDRYEEGAERARQGIADYSRGTADIFSRIDAPGRQRQREGIAFGRMGSDIGTIASLADSDRFMDEMRLRSIRRNPWIDAAGQAMQSYGMSGGGMGGGSTSSASPAYGDFGGMYPTWGSLGLGGGRGIYGGG